MRGSIVHLRKPVRPSRAGMTGDGASCVTWYLMGDRAIP